MKTIKQIIILAALLIATLPLTAQLKIDTDNRTGIGINPHYLAKLRLYGAAERNTLEIESNFFTTGNKRGIYNYSFASGGVGTTYGIYNDVKRNGTGSLIGIFNNIQASGTGSKVGVRSLLTDQNSVPSGNGEVWMVATDVQVQHYNYDKAFGNYIWMRDFNSSSSDTTYGNYITFQDMPNLNNAVGIYSKVPMGSGNFAAQFVGDMALTGGTFGASDERLKEDSREITESLALLKRIQPMSYRFKQNPHLGFSGEGLHYGFMADQVEQVFPDLVKDIYYPADYTVEDSRDSTASLFSAEHRRMVHPGATYKAVRYTDFIPILVGGVQEQQVAIEAIQTALADLPTVLGKSNANEAVMEQLEKENVLLKDELTALREEVTELRAEFVRLRECTDCYGDRPILDGRVSAPETKEEISVYPNPASDQVTINHRTSDRYDIQILDANGRRIKRIRAQNQVNTIDVSSWPAGAYLFVIREGKFILKRERVIVSGRGR